MITISTEIARIKSKTIGTPTQPPVTDQQLAKMTAGYVLLRTGVPDTYLQAANMWTTDATKAMVFPDARRLWAAAHRLSISGLVIKNAPTAQDIAQVAADKKAMQARVIQSRVAAKAKRAARISSRKAALSKPKSSAKPAAALGIRPTT